VTHLLGERRVFQIGQSRATEFIVLMRGRRHEHVPQAFGTRLFLQLFQDWDGLPALALGILLLVDRHGRADMLVHERLHTIEPFALAVRHVEVIGRSSHFWTKLLAALSPRRRFTARPFIQTVYRAADATRSAGGVRTGGRSVMRIDIPTFKP